MKIFVRMHVKFFKRIRFNHFKLKHSRRNPSAPENRQASGLCPTQTLRGYVNTGRTSGGRKSEIGSWPGCSQSGPENVSRMTSNLFSPIFMYVPCPLYIVF